MDVFEAMFNMRAMRRLKPDPVPWATVRRILEAGIAAPNGGNQQRWRFLVVTDPEVKSKVQVYYERAFREHVQKSYEDGPPPPAMDKAGQLRQLKAVEYLTVHFHEAPVWIVACMKDGESALFKRPSVGAQIYPAVQNMLLAARSLGLGATLTTRHTNYQKEVDEIFQLPEDVHSYAIIPLGYPLGKFGPTRRGDVDSVVYGSTWGVSVDQQAFAD